VLFLARHSNLHLRLDDHEWKEQDWRGSSLCHSGQPFDVPDRNTEPWLTVSCDNGVARWITIHKNTSWFTLGFCGLRINATKIGDLPPPISPPPLTTPVVLPALPPFAADWSPEPNQDAFELRPALHEVGDNAWALQDEQWISPRQVRRQGVIAADNA